MESSDISRDTLRKESLFTAISTDVREVNNILLINFSMTQKTLNCSWSLYWPSSIITLKTKSN